MQELGETVLAAEPRVDTVRDLRAGHGHRHEKEIAVGGCPVLDADRACSAPGALTVFPSILSQSCLSANRSVLTR
ncbi:hypothetical protein ABTY96_12335 [Streptomyces sp. NPDC096057]|uniref:hypothetical protein n=1 Tax=Streptomyces sp. NPDC096057 TaxID=3155543 RepID=UPI0033287732